METFLAFVFLFVMLAALVVGEMLWPRKGRAKIIGALEDAKRIGNSDVESNPKAFVYRWRYMLLGVKEAKKYKTEEYVSELQQQLDLMRPHEDVVRKNSSSSWTIDLPVIWP